MKKWLIFVNRVVLLWFESINLGLKTKKLELFPQNKKDSPTKQRKNKKIKNREKQKKEKIFEKQISGNFIHVSTVVFPFFEICAFLVDFGKVFHFRRDEFSISGNGIDESSEVMFFLDFFVPDYYVTIVFLIFLLFYRYYSNI